MGSQTAIALVGFAGWFALLSVVLGVFRVGLVLSGKKAANSFAVDGSDIAGFGQRLTRARDNCYETLPIFVAIALGAQMMGALDVTDGLAMWVLAARVGQSIVHVISVSVPAVLLRANLFFIQVLIYVYWAVVLIT